MKLKKNTGIYVGIWITIFLSPLLYVGATNAFWWSYLRYSIIPALLLFTYLTNYYLLVPHLFFKNHRLGFAAANLTLVFFQSWLIHLWMVMPLWNEHLMVFKNETGVVHSNVVLVLFMKNALSLTAASGVALAMRLMRKWTATEQKRQQAEQARVDAELQTLRSEIHPHFLLNTLNNIYALIAFDSEKAQRAVWDLGDMLRHILYDNQQKRVSVQSEVRFVDEYVRLMSLRLRSEVKVTTAYGIPEGCNMMIVPNICITLVENAFKHGVPSSGESHIDIRIAASNGVCELCITNSNHPQKHNSDTGHGVGMAYIKKRLDLEYNSNYKWTYGLINDNKDYQTKIIFYDT